MVRLAHLSDIHISVPRLDWRSRDWFSKRYTSWINYRWLGRRDRFRRADEVLGILMADIDRRNIDHIIFSGDATALGFESEFARAAELLETTRGRPGLAVPGNHDYCTPFAALSGLFERHFTPWQQGQRIEEQRYPFAQRVGPIWLVGVNSATGNVWPWDSGGGVGQEQLDRLRRLLAGLDAAPRILITHYPACLADGRPERTRRGLRDVGPLIEIAGWAGIRAWLHGHRHEPYVLPRTQATPFAVLCAGSATQIGAWSYFEYDVDEEHLRILRRCFDETNNQFRDAETYTVALTHPASAAVSAAPRSERT